MRTLVSGGLKIPLFSSVARVASNFILNAEYIQRAVCRLGCARMNTRRLHPPTILLFVLGATALPIAGCGGGGSSNSAAEQPQSSASEEAPDPADEEVSNPPVAADEEADNPPVAEEEVISPPVAEEEVISPPVAEEEVISPPVAEEEVYSPPVAEEEVNDPPVEEAYVDDTHEILQSSIDVETVSGNFGYDEYRASEPDNGEPLAVDARNASFIVANSKNSNPTDDVDCDTGSQPVNRYPVKVYDPEMAWVVGGIINDDIPQESDWRPTYCNSAALIFKRAPYATVDGLRITGAWDAIRTSDNSPDLAVRNSWISNVRDDAVENDGFMPLVFEDNLVDGAFQGISVHSDGNISTQSTETVHVYGSVVRIREYLYKGRQQYGALFKNERSSPTSIIEDTVVAVDYKGGSTWSSYWERSWSKIEDCSNNLFLWLSDQPIPSAVGAPPACFKVLTGAAARAEWDRAKQNWIDCHPELARMPTDPASNPAQCVANTFGGYSRGEGDPLQL